MGIGAPGKKLRVALTVTTIANIGQGSCQVVGRLPAAVRQHQLSEAKVVRIVAQLPLTEKAADLNILYVAEPQPIPQPAAKKKWVSVMQSSTRRQCKLPSHLGTAEARRRTAELKAPSDAAEAAVARHAAFAHTAAFAVAGSTKALVGGSAATAASRPLRCRGGGRRLRWAAWCPSTEVALLRCGARSS